MISPTKPIHALRTCLHDQGLFIYLRVMATDPWADVEATLVTINVEDITTEAIHAYMDLQIGGIKDVETLDEQRIAAYYREYSNKSKKYKAMGGQSDLFKEFSVLFMTVVMLHMNLYVMLKGKACLLVSELEGHKIDWTEWKRRASYDKSWQIKGGQ